MTTQTDNLIESVTQTLNPKQKKVLVKRFELTGNGTRHTLQGIGDELSVTRERVRQIENQATKKIRNATNKQAKELIKKAGEIAPYKIRVRDDFKIV
mgnify:CR=1 FL=1